MILSHWQYMAETAMRRIGRTVKFSATRDVYTQIAEQIVADGKGAEFLKSARRGRPTVQPFRRLLVANIERMIEVKCRKPRAKPRAALPMFAES